MTINEPVFSHICKPYDMWCVPYQFLQSNYPNHSGWDYNAHPNYEAKYDMPNRGTSERDLGMPLLAPFPGEVIFAGRMRLSNGAKSAYGRVVKIRTHPYYFDYIMTRLKEAHPKAPYNFDSFEVLDVCICHMYQISVEKNDFVNSGDVVGSMGGSGGAEASYPCHAHVSVQYKPSGDLVVYPQIRSGRKKTADEIRADFLDPALLWSSKVGCLNMAREPDSQPTAIHPKRDFYLPSPAGVVAST